MLTGKIQRNLKLGLDSLRAHKLRSTLTTLGIVFGVASVICMLAIGEGLSFEAREQIRRLGSNNIIMRSVKPPSSASASQSSRPGMITAVQYGLTYADLERIVSTVPKVEVIVPTREIRKDIWLNERRVSGNVIGTVPWYLETTNGRLIAGRYINSMDMHSAANVCVLNVAAAKNLAGLSNLLGSTLNVGSDCYKVVGIVDSSTPSVGSGQKGEGRTQNEIHIPLTAARQRFGEIIMESSSGSTSMERVELHGAVVRVASSEDVISVSRVIESLLLKAHDKRDYEMIVPLQLLREKERVRRLYNIVLGSMAAISLLVGGIGIMNIMLATVTERTREIGIRRAIGAKKRDIAVQFLIETLLLSGFGGMSGILLGVGLPWLIRTFTEMNTIVTVWAVMLSFCISGLIGVVFGFYPAIRAANMDPIAALRHE